MALWQEWWVWGVAGVVLAILEVMIPGFILLGFAIGALLTALLLWVGLLGGALGPMLLVFALGALTAWGLLRKLVGIRAGQTKIWDKDINEG